MKSSRCPGTQEARTKLQHQLDRTQELPWCLNGGCTSPKHCSTTLDEQQGGLHVMAQEWFTAWLVELVWKWRCNKLYRWEPAEQRARARGQAQNHHKQRFPSHDDQSSNRREDSPTKRVSRTLSCHQKHVLRAHWQPSINR